jgi:hypothetical protein
MLSDLMSIGIEAAAVGSPPVPFAIREVVPAGAWHS